jgi:DNA-binding SARP family transcriptional activator
MMARGTIRGVPSRLIASEAAFMTDSDALGASSDARAPRWRLRLLGPPQVVLPDGSRVLLARRDAGVLAYLALEGETTRQRLLELLWPEEAQDLARNTLRQRMYQLKKRCGIEVVHGVEALTLTAALELDLRHDGAESGTLLDGHDFADCADFTNWLLGQREKLIRGQRDALTARAEAAERDGRLAEAITAAEQLTALDPLQEHGHRRLMRLHYLRGDRAAALAAFDRCERILKDELGAKPGDETLALLKTVETSGALVATPVRHPIPAAVLRPPRLIGRVRELEALTVAWESARAFLLLGEAGLGKTRLLGELAAATPGAVHVQARPGDAAVPYGSLARVLRALIERVPAALDTAPRRELARVLPELGEVAPGLSETQRPALQRAVSVLIEAASRTGVSALLIDDLHYADQATLEMFCELGAGQSAHAPLRWGFAARPAAEQEARAAIDRLVAARRLESVSLTALDEPQMADLVESLGMARLDGPRMAPLLMRHTGGNPLFALETIKQMSLGETSLAELPRPTSVGQLIEGRLRHLSQRATALARVAAVAGVDFSVGIAEAVTGASALDLADAWEELETAHILRGSAFAHDLVYEAALATVPQAIARHLHQAIAAWLQGHGGLPVRIAHHYASAGLPALAAEHWLAAARSAHAALRFAEATDAFERAAYGFAEGGRNEMAFEAAYSMRMASFEIDLRERSGAALELLERFAATPVQRARAHNERAVTRLHQGDLPGTEQSAVAGLRELGGADAPLLRSELRRNLAATYAWRNQTQAALNELRSIQHDVERLGSPQQKFELWDSLAIVLDHVCETEEAERTHRRAFDAALEIGNLPGAAQSALNLAVNLHDAGRMPEAHAMNERARALLAAVQAERLSYSSLNLNSGFVLRGLGEYGGALEQLAIAIENCRAQTPGWLPFAMAHRAQLFLQLGQPARAQQDLEAGAPDDRTPLSARCKWVTVRAMLQHQIGRNAVADIDAALALHPAQGRPLIRWRLERVRLLHVDAAEAASRGGALLEELDAARRTSLAIGVRAVLATQLARLDRHEQARLHAQRALQDMQKLYPDDIYRGDVWWSCCGVLQQEADAELERAVAWVEDTARLRVPAEFRDSFLNRNPSNRELLRAASRRRPRLS